MAFQGTVSDFYAAGLVSPLAVHTLHYGDGLPTATGDTGRNDPAFEIEYAPYGVNSGLCMGMATTAISGEGVTLQPCGVSAKTVWIVDTFDSSPVHHLGGYFPLINGSDTNFSQPFVLTYPTNGFPTDMPRPQLTVTNLTGFSNGSTAGRSSARSTPTSSGARRSGSSARQPELAAERHGDVGSPRGEPASPPPASPGHDLPGFPGPLQLQDRSGSRSCPDGQSRQRAEHRIPIVAAGPARQPCAGYGCEVPREESFMSIKSKVLAAAATLTMVGGVGMAGALTAGTASAATPSCGPSCINVFSKQFGTHQSPNFTVDVLRQGEKAGQPIILFRTANYDPALDWTVAFQGTVSDFHAAGLVSARARPALRHARRA